MSYNIPFEIQMDILERIPDVKSLIQFRSVSKAWKSVIDSKDFIIAHTLRRHTTCHDQATDHLFVKTADDCQVCPEDIACVCDTPVIYVSIVDDDTFPHQKLSVFIPDSVNKVNKYIDENSIILGSSYGLFCLYELEVNTVVIWNPSIRKTVATEIPNLGDQYYDTVVGFGVCPRNLDPKIVKITFPRFPKSMFISSENYSTQVEVFTGGTWRIPFSNLPHEWIAFTRSRAGYHAGINGFIYWSAWYRGNVIISFDLTNEEFTKVNLPDDLARAPDNFLSLTNLRESLVVLKFDIHTQNTCDVWMMIGHGCTRSFNKLYSINTHMVRTLGFHKSGALIFEMEDIEDNWNTIVALAMYEPESKSIKNIGIYGLFDTFFVHSYVETLLLLDHRADNR